MINIGESADPPVRGRTSSAFQAPQETDLMEGNCAAAILRVMHNFFTLLPVQIIMILVTILDVVFLLIEFTDAAPHFDWRFIWDTKGGFTFPLTARG